MVSQHTHISYFFKMLLKTVNCLAVKSEFSQILPLKPEHHGPNPPAPLLEP